MKDIILYGQLKALGIPAAKAWQLTAKIRDTLHPVAALAAAKLHGSGVPARKGMGLNIQGGVQDASLGAKAGSVVPIVGSVVGGIIGAAIGAFFGPAKLGQASVTWNDMVAHGYLQQERGAQFDERYFAEAMKGAMDEGNNVWPGCGPDRHKNPDCFYGPLAQVIRAAYVSGAVPVTATTQQVWQQVVLPWLASGANGLVNWQTLSHEPGQPAGNTLQMLLIEGAVDRYINGLPITRADMPEYQGQGYTDHEPSISAVLAQAQASPTVSSAVATQPVASVPSQIVAQGASVAAQASPAISSANPQSTTSSILSSLLAQNGVGMTSPAAQQVVSQVAAQGVTQTAYGPSASAASGMPSWLVPAGIVGVIALKVL